MVNKTERSVWRRLEQWVKKLKCSGSSGISLETFKDINVGVDPSPLAENIPKIKIFDPITSEVIQHKLGKDCNTGDEIVTLDISEETTLVLKLKNGLRHGKCEYYSINGDVESIKGMKISTNFHNLNIL